MEVILAIRGDEGIGLDPDRLQALWRELGPDTAETVVRRAMGEMGERLSEIAQAKAHCDMGGITRGARRLSRLADHVGMRRIARVSDDVVLCAGRADGVALGATCARLGRLCERALAEMCDAQGMTI